MGELWQESASALAEMIASGATSSREVCESHLERIDAVNADVNAVVDVRADEVLRDADHADALRARGEALGPLHGVPFTVKVNIDVAGYATSEGCETLKDFVANDDAPTVERMRAAGAVMLARTNMPDMGLRLNTESSLYGATHNPWRRGLTAGGSSGGEASAIASGMSPVGLGNDIGGSLRNPAFACGITSIKPSRGRVPQGNPSSPIEMSVDAQFMLAEGPLARHVRDLRRTLAALMGAHHRDPQSVHVPLTGPAVPRRVALVANAPGGATDPAIADGVRAAGRALESHGYQVEEVEPPMFLDACLSWAEMVWSGITATEPILMATMGEGGRRFLELTDIGLEPASAESIVAMFQSRYRVARAWREFLTTYPLIVGPTWTQFPFELGFDIRDQESALKVVDTVRFVLPANLLGLPALCVPTGTANGLATGAQIIADIYREDLCLDAGEVVEEVLGVLTPIDPRR